MARYAKGKYAWGICDRTGWKVPYKDLRREWNGLLVHKSVWEPKHPQLTPRRITSDAAALKDPRPDRDIPGDITDPCGLYEDDTEHSDFTRWLCDGS